MVPSPSPSQSPVVPPGTAAVVPGAAVGGAVVASPGGSTSAEKGGKVHYHFLREMQLFCSLTIGRPRLPSASTAVHVLRVVAVQTVRVEEEVGGAVHQVLGRGDALMEQLKYFYMEIIIVIWEYPRLLKRLN